MSLTANNHNNSHSIEQLQQQIVDLQIQLSTAVEHGDAIEAELNDNNIALQNEIHERKRAESQLQLLLRQVTEQRDELKASLSTALKHKAEMEQHLEAVNRELSQNRSHHQSLESQLRHLVKNLNQQKDDLELLVETLVNHGDQIQETIHQQLDHSEKQAQTDGLTQLNNRHAFNLAIEQAWCNGCQSRSPLAMIIADIDHFKSYNDTFGHDGGDDCLIRVSQIWAQINEQPQATTARLGGEEFVALLPGHNASEAAEIAEQIRNRISQLKIDNPNSSCGHITISLGVSATIPEANQSWQQLYRQTDQALYKAKASGRNRVQRSDDQ